MSEPSYTGATWVPIVPPADALARMQAGGLSPVAARCAAIRWSEGAAAPWEAPSLDHLERPEAMLGMDAAVERLRRAIRDRQRVRVVTDYDVDGTTSSLILQAALSLAGAEQSLDYHIPHRFKEGYGFSTVAADAAADDKVDLIVTADIGVRDHAAVNRAVERGVDVLICDHHLPAGEDVPEAALVLCPPQAACDYPNPALAACGISLKVAQALLAKDPRHERIVSSLLKLAAIGTVADMVSLATPENRAIVALGLRSLNTGPHHPGLAALLEAAGLKLGEIGEEELGYRVGPRINAAGRMADAKLVVELLNCRDANQAKALAQRVEQHNSERRTVQDKLAHLALEMAQASDAPFVVVGGSEEHGWHRGVVGIVASRVKDEVHRPVAVVSIQGDFAVGSVRSIPGLHAVKALDAAHDLLLKYGGHPAAAGFTVRTRDLEALKQRLSAYVHRADADLEAVREIDAEIEAPALDWNLHRELTSLGPFGIGNPQPRLIVRNIVPRRVQLLGATQRMVKFQIDRPAQGPLEAIWWDQARHADRLADQPVDVLGTLAINRYRGRELLQFRVTDARAAR